MQELAPDAQKSGNVWIMGNVNGDKGGSMWVYRTGARAGGWVDAGNAESRKTGDMIHFVMLNRGLPNIYQSAEYILLNWG